MGNCCKRDAAADYSKMVDKGLNKEQRRLENEVKLLLLGSGESGKSTIFKQMRVIYDKEYTPSERMEYRDIVVENTITCMRTLIQALDKLGIHLPSGDEVNSAVQRVSRITDAVLLQNAHLQLNKLIADDIAMLWKLPAIQSAYQERAKFQLIDNCAFFMQHVHRIASDDYTPTAEDVLLARRRTVGIVTGSFRVPINPDHKDAKKRKEVFLFNMVDVGGQRNERRKWIHVFDSVTAIIFVTSLSEYNQVLFEDGRTNRMAESLALFQEIANNRYFKRTSIIIFFNKNDLFKEKVEKVDLPAEVFPEYRGGRNYDNALTYLKQQFITQNKQPESVRQIYSHVTQATDTSQMRAIFLVVKNIILHENLRQAGLLAGGHATY